VSLFRINKTKFLINIYKITHRKVVQMYTLRILFQTTDIRYKLPLTRFLLVPSSPAYNTGSRQQSSDIKEKKLNGIGHCHRKYKIIIIIKKTRSISKISKFR